MRDQYKILAEKYKLVEENYTGHSQRAEYMFDQIKKKPGVNFFAHWLAINDVYMGEHAPDYNDQRQVDDFLSAWLDSTLDNFEDAVNQEIQDNESDKSDDEDEEDATMDPQDEAEDRTWGKLINYYNLFITDRKSEEYKAWKSYEAAQKQLHKGSEEAGFDLDV